jgi:hypothetical protein
MSEQTSYRYEIQGTDFHQGVLAAVRAYPAVCAVSLDAARERLTLESNTPFTMDQISQFIDAIERAGGSVIATRFLTD